MNFLRFFVEIDRALFFAAFHDVESTIWEVFEGCPKVPEWQIEFVGEQGHVAVDSVVEFAVVGFGGEDGDNAFVD